VRLELSDLDYLDYWLQCIHAFTASYSSTGVVTASSSAAIPGSAFVARLSPAVLLVGTNRAALHDDPDQQLTLVGAPR